MSATIGRPEIEHAGGVIAPHVRATPILGLDGSAFGLRPFRLTLKLEQLQVSGSFKARGAFANLLLREVPPAGVVAASGGNHGAAVACAAMRLGRPARIYVPVVSSPAKVSRIQSYGADLQITGERYADALAASEAWAASSGAMTVHAFDQRETLLGTGTLGREITLQVPDVDTLLVAVGGGGLIAGIAAWCAGRPAHRGALASAPQRAVIGVEPAAAPTLTEALRAGRPVDAPAGGIAADSLAPRRIGELVYPIAKAHVDRVLLVEDAEIVRAQRALWETARLVAEPGGAAPLAALLSGRYEPAAGEHVAVIVSGGNTDSVAFRDAV